MATLNEMIAQGAQFNVPDPTAQYNKLAQMQKYQQENELAKMQMEEYGRARQESNALRQFLPGLNESNRSQLLGFGTAGQGVYKTLAEGDTQQRLRDQARSQADLNEAKILTEVVARTRNVVAGIDPNDAPSYMALRESIVAQYPKLAPYMPNAWNANVQQSLIVTADNLLEGQKPRPPVILKPGEMAIPGNDPRLTGLGVTAPAAAAAAAAVPPSVAEYQFAKTVDGGSFVGSYQDFVKAKADATRAPTPVAAPQALPASVQEYEYAKTVPGGSFVGTYQDFVKAKADAARAPAPISAPQALPQSVAEYNFAKTPEGGGFVGTLTDFMQARAEATRAPAPIVAPQAQPASVLEYNFAKTPDGGGFVGTYQDFVQSKAEAGRAPVPITAPPTKVAEYEYAKTPAGGSYKGTYQQFLNLGKSEGGTADRAPSMTTIVDPTNPNQMLSIDARRYAGGGVGSVGVIGVSGKEPGAAIRQNKVEAGKTQLADDLENLRASFLTLDKMGAIPSTNRNPLSNIASATAASGIGQILGRATGTEAQVEREVINSARTRLVNSIKNATGMSAQQLNSNVELQTMLKSISDPGQPVQAALRIIEDIENAYVKGAEMPKKNAPGGSSAPAPTAPASNITQQRQDANAAIAKGAPAAAVRQRFKQNTGQEL